MSKTKEQNKATVAAWRARNPEKAKEQTQSSYWNTRDVRLPGKRKSNRKSHLKKVYGLTPEAYDKMLASQNGRCAICKDLPGKKALAVDHDHASGKIRALLCTRCNTGLGGFKDDIYLLRQAMIYVSKHRGIT